MKISLNRIHSLPLRMNVDEAARALKSITVRTLLEKFLELRRYLWNGNS